MGKYRLNAMAAFTVNIVIDAKSREDAFKKYESMREEGKIEWVFLDTMDVNCDEIEDRNGKVY